MTHAWPRHAADSTRKGTKLALDEVRSEDNSMCLHKAESFHGDFAQVGALNTAAEADLRSEVSFHTRTAAEARRAESTLNYRLLCLTWALVV